NGGRPLRSTTSPANGGAVTPIGLRTHRGDSIDADTELVVALGRPLPGNRNDCRAYAESGAAHACRNAVVIADGGYQGTSAIIPHRRVPGRDLPEWKQAHNASHRKVRARVEHTFARMKT